MDDNEFVEANPEAIAVKGVASPGAGILSYGLVDSGRYAKYEASPGGRPDHDTYFMSIARAVAERATCPRRKVGAVVVFSNHIVSTGYNGSPAGQPHCIDEGCDFEHGHCVRTIHAELNALIQAASVGGTTMGTTLYTTASPCRNCMGAIINAGVSRVVYADPYRDLTHQSDKSRWAFEAAQRRGIAMVNLVKGSR